MFEGPKLRRKIAKIERTQRRVRAAYDADINKAKAEKKSREEIEKIEDLARFEYMCSEGEISVLCVRES